MHLHLPTTQVRTKIGTYHQICRCGYYRIVSMSAIDGSAARPWCKPNMTARNWHQKARSVLELLEWSGKNGRYNACPVCKSVGPTHKPDCLMDRLLYDETSFRVG